MNPYHTARELYAEIGVDTEQALQQLAAIPISLQCWQGDDVRGFESSIDGELGSGLAVTGNHPGRAHSLEELRRDLDEAYALIPGRHRLNLHACYADLGGRKLERDAYGLAEFQSWIDWAKERNLGLDFNPTLFAHPLAGDGFTLSHRDAGVRDFWIRHCQASRRIGAEMGRQLDNPCVTNIWIPDGYKDLPADRLAPRTRLRESLDKIFSDPVSEQDHLDALESKLFGIGSEACVIGSHEFYLGYAVQNRKLYCLDAGHFHPTESVADKISSLLLFLPGLLFHVSRGLRWDSDHVVILDDNTQAIAQEIIRSGHLDRIHLGLDYFDASINRIAAWAIGLRAVQKALLQALLEPSAQLRGFEAQGDYTARLELTEQMKELPSGLVWREFCLRHNVPGGPALLQKIRAYESAVLSQRSA